MWSIIQYLEFWNHNDLQASLSVVGENMHDNKYVADCNNKYVADYDKNMIRQAVQKQQ